MSARFTAFTLAALGCLVLGSIASPAEAQYFGRNKVLYRTFEFKVLHTEHFDVYYYPEEAAAAEQAGRMAERWYARLSDVFAHDLSNRQPLILYASHTAFEQTNAIPGELEEGTGGVTESIKRRIVLPLGSSLEETDHVIGHELVHAFQYDMTGRSQGSTAPAVQRLPLWFIEGMAEYMSIGPVDPNTAMWMRDAAYFNDLPTVKKLDDPIKYFPYRWGEALWAYVGQRWGDRAISELMRVGSRSGELNSAIAGVLGMSADSLSRDWQNSLRALAAEVPRRDPDQVAHTLVTASRGDIGRYNLAPSLSPDGSRMMFLSERSLYSMDLYLADARTGKIQRKVTKTAVDPHLQSLEFVSGAGAWSPDSKRFAFSSVREGRAVITVIDAASGKQERLYPLPGVDEVLTVSWSPDGRAFAFSGLAGGHTDLYTLPVSGGRPHRLTNDLYADLQPAWSPDGKSIAFVTERFTSRIDSLEIGTLRPALWSEEGGIRPLPAMEDFKHIDPQWSPDGRDLYMVVERRGIPNVFRLDLANGAWERVTDISSGVSGLTPYSPAISIAARGDRMVIDAYQHGTYNLYAIDSVSTRSEPLGPAEPSVASLIPFELQGAPQLAVRAPSESLFARGGPRHASLGAPAAFPSEPGENVIRAEEPNPALPESIGPIWHPTPATPAPKVANLVNNLDYGLPDTSGFHRAPYHPRLSLDRVSQVELGLGTSGSGGLAGVGGAALMWSDMLGDQNLGTFLEISSNGGPFLRNVAAVGDYTNLRSRLNWGGEVSQLPYITRQIVEDIVTVNGTDYLRQQDIRFWQTERRVVGTLAYPFSRAERIELSGGYQNIDFAEQVETRLIDANGFVYQDNTNDINTGLPNLNLAVTDVAWVHDDAVFGGTSPLVGSRARLDVQPVLGDLHYTGLLADWRAYLMPARPWTIALRALHYGRYGRDGAAPVLSPLFLGYPNLIRGYDDNSFAIGEASTPTYSRLFGDRIAVANVELRIPLVGPFGLFPTPGVPPLEIAPFFDAGAAWNDAQTVHFSGPDQNGVTSAGLAMRANLFGFLIGEVDLVHPNDRPGKGWYWEFAVQPGY